jgi:6-pyruvoyltetrahydropterin/6-carboxytetrahydropterin synthase
MATTALTRSLRFRALHHYWRSEWSAAENRRVFGENVHPHEHEYGLDVTVTGEVDGATGFIVDLAALDDALEALVGPLRGKDLLDAIPAADDGARGMMPSTENLARWFFDRLEPRVPAPARLVRVRVSESDTLSSEVRRTARL